MEVKDILNKKFTKYFNEEPTSYFVSPGRLEIIGNHTDHNSGTALVASASLYVKSATKERNDNKVVLYSENYKEYVVDIKESEPDPKFFSTTFALINGIITGFLRRGYKVGGVSIYCFSEVLSGSGISSSAAFELLICTIFNELFNEGKIDKMVLVHISQEAEKFYFGKPCGLLDQIGCAYGGISFVDFKDQAAPQVKNISFPFNVKIVLTNPGGSHAGLDSYYASIPNDMKSVASALGKTYLRECNEKELDEYISKNPSVLSEQQINRARHFFKECERVKCAYEGIDSDNLEVFLENINASGNSSSSVLKNTQVPDRFANSPERALQIARKAAPKSAHRVHGGGFMGTIISFCREDEYDALVKAIRKEFGPDSIIDISISPIGSSKI